MRSTVALLLIFSLTLPGGSFDAFAQSHKKTIKKSSKPKSPPCRVGCKPATSDPLFSSTSPEAEAAQHELSLLALNLHLGVPGAYDKLSSFATKNAATAWGARAALALGYDDLTKSHAPQALAWFTKAKADPLLTEYVLYWTSQAKHALNRNAESLADLAAIQQDFPATALKEQVVIAIAAQSSEARHPQQAIDALNSYSATATKPSLLIERARAYNLAGKPVLAAKDYQTVYYKFALSDEAKAASTALTQLNKQLHGEFPYATAELQQQRAQAFYEAHKWKEARSEFEKLTNILRDPANPVRQHAQLRVVQARMQPKGSVSLLTGLKLADPEVEAERLYTLSQVYRSEKKEAEMLSAIEDIAQKFPQSRWTEEGLMSAGNYFWVSLDRARAAAYYQRVLDVFPGGKNAFNAEWRIAWVAYLGRQPYADDRLTAFLRKYPISSDASDALYWLGRNAERAGNIPRARSLYAKTVDRFPQTYFARAASARLIKLGPGEEDAPEFLSQIPPPPPLHSLDEPIPEAAVERWNRAQALRTIAFDASAELELKAAYFATTFPRFLIEAAQVAFEQGHFGTGMAYGRTAVPNFEARKFGDIPVSAWKALYPLPYEAALRREAARNDFDPMLAAGLIRQESTFQADAVSHANAIGLMQILPKTGKLLAKQLKVRYTKTQLFNPDYNIQLGMLYIANLVRLTGSPEFAAAAYNAGEDRIALWKSERPYEEIPEVVESIPFSETRDYVQIVLRNAELYRMIYGTNGSSATTASASVPVFTPPVLASDDPLKIDLLKIDLLKIDWNDPPEK
ncbi:MAG TPA: transglycosylase SLT domain-containing protein [Candidatus Dormibacteraeota bacterium]|nr:transglycosylase SLT domain-containing protein [Candidatus Dormibacteraeota bacterium]